MGVMTRASCSFLVSSCRRELASRRSFMLALRDTPFCAAPAPSESRCVRCSGASLILRLVSPSIELVSI